MDEQFKSFFEWLEGADDYFDITECVCTLYGEITAEHTEKSEAVNALYLIWDWICAGTDQGMYSAFEHLDGDRETVRTALKYIRRFAGEEAASQYISAADELMPLLEGSAEGDIDEVSQRYDDYVMENEEQLIFALKNMMLECKDEIAETMSGVHL